MGGVIYALTFLPYLFMMDNFDRISLDVILVSSLLSNVAMACGWNLIGQFEGQGTMRGGTTKIFKLLKFRYSSTGCLVLR